MKALNTKVNLNHSESGAALITVVMVATLLSIASIAILTGVGANSRNSTDVLSEAKAYYAAESGLQATINVLRNTSAATYGAAVGDPDLSTWLTYNCTTPAVSISVGPAPCTAQGTSYSIAVTDPDAAGASTTFSTLGGFAANGAVTISIKLNGELDPTNAEPDRVTLTYNPQTSCVISFFANTTCNTTASDPNAPLGSFSIETFGTGASTVQLPDLASGGIRFLINYSISVPINATRTMRGTISQETAGGPVAFTFDVGTPTTPYDLAGTDIILCETSTTDPCAGISLSLNLPAPSVILPVPVFMNTGPMQPRRLKVLSTGFGPNGARKQLEGIIQNNFFNGLSGPSAITMQGDGDGLVFDPGNSAVFEIDGVNFPSVGVVDPDGLDEVEDGIPDNNDNIVLAPEVVSDIPDWMTTPQKLDAVISQLRTTAQQNGRYYDHPTQNLDYVGDNAAGTGITFCEGDCKAGVDGGGILVVTGQLTNIGGWSFKGLIIVTGPEGWLRKGGGEGNIIGFVLIAPYGPDQLVSNTFSLPPKYQVTGGGVSNVEYDADVLVDVTFNGTSAISNFMLGVAEK